MSLKILLEQLEDKSFIGTLTPHDIINSESNDKTLIQYYIVENNINRVRELVEFYVAYKIKYGKPPYHLSGYVSDFNKQLYLLKKFVKTIDDLSDEMEEVLEPLIGKIKYYEDEYCDLILDKCRKDVGLPKVERIYSDEESDNDRPVEY